MRQSIRSFAVLFALVLGSCVQQSPTAPVQPPADLGLTGSVEEGLSPMIGLLTCDPLPYQLVKQKVGSGGGKVTVGPHTLVIPRGALRREALITAEIFPDSASSVRFTPEGLRFAKPATVTLSYAHCQGATALIPKRVAYTTDLLAILEYLDSRDDARRQRVSANLDHFSRYAVAW
jgi:hypothetical protein